MKVKDSGQAKRPNEVNTVSLIIPTKDRPDLVIRCLESILAQTRLPDEVLVVDGSDTNELKSKIESHFGENRRIAYIHTELGLPHQRNVGIAASTGDIIVFIDDDVVLDSDYIRQMAAVFDRYAPGEIGGATGNIGKPKRAEPGLIRKALRPVVRSLLTLFLLSRPGDGRFQASGRPTILYNAEAVTEMEYLEGCNMAFRRDVITEFMFDENLSGYAWGEDDDIAYRVSRRYPTFYVPLAKGMHFAGPRANPYAQKKMALKNHYYLYRKNLPHDFRHGLAFWWSVLGMFLVEGVIAGAYRRDTSLLRGLSRGLFDIVRRQ